MDAAQAALRQAHELYLAQWHQSAAERAAAGSTARAPSIPIGAITAPTVAADPTYNLYTAQLSVSYLPDVFGGTRRANEAAKANEDANRFQLEATYLTLTSNVVVDGDPGGLAAWTDRCNQAAAAAAAAAARGGAAATRGRYGQ